MKATELEFLEYFYDKVCDALGPSDDEIYDMIKESFVQDTGLELPDEYTNES